jgi:soluble lytic murein transglycosylase-like protein
MKSKIRPSIRLKRILYKFLLVLIFITPLIIYIDQTRVDEVSGLTEAAFSTRETPTIAAMEAVEIKPPLYDIPLSYDLQEFTYEYSIEQGVDPVMVLAIMDCESEFQEDKVSPYGDYGIMQINECNHKYITDSLGEIDFLDAKQNIKAGIFFLSGICKNNTDPNKILMVYNMSGSVAQELWDEGRESTAYSRGIIKDMEEIKEKKVII